MREHSFGWGNGCGLQGISHNIHTHTVSFPEICDLLSHLKFLVMCIKQFGMQSLLSCTHIMYLWEKKERYRHLHSIFLQIKAATTVYLTMWFTATVQGQPLFKGGRNMVLCMCHPYLLYMHWLCVSMTSYIRDLTDSMTVLTGVGVPLRQVHAWGGISVKLWSINSATAAFSPAFSFLVAGRRSVMSFGCSNRVGLSTGLGL